MKKVLVIGASSYIGARIYWELHKEYELVGTYNTNPLSKDFVKLDLANKEEIEKLINEVNPEVILHFGNVPTAKVFDLNPENSKKVNVDATAIICEAIKDTNIKFVYISSMFQDESSYGKSKLESEKIIRENSKNFIILEPFFVLGYSPNTTNDRPFNRLLKNLDENTPAIYDNSWTMQPTYLKHLAQVIAACIKQDVSNETIKVTIQARKTRFNIAQDILAPFGVDVKTSEVSDTTTATFFDDGADLERLNLPKFNYEDMIKEIIEEIKSRDMYKL